jgi:hypothetical protein
MCWRFILFPPPVTLTFHKANGTGKSNILRLVEFFLIHGTGNNVKLHWEQGDSVWEPHKQCLASLVFRLTPQTRDIFSKWRLTAIIALLLRQKNVKQLLLELEESDVRDTSSTSHVQVCVINSSLTD